MNLGDKLLKLRKEKGLSQEEVAEKLGISRQTISKWETNQTIPDMSKMKSLSQLYNITYDYLINDREPSGDITNMEAMVDQIDWTLAWSKKYPILVTYQGLQGITKYQQKMEQLYQTFQTEFDMNNTDTVLILKDILYKIYKQNIK